MSQEPVLLNIYANGGDVHSMTAVGMWNRKHPERPVEYDEFMLGRELSEMFRDADGKVDESKFTKEHLDKLVAEDKLSPDIAYTNKLEELVELGYKFEKTRKDAKVVK